MTRTSWLDAIETAGLSGLLLVLVFLGGCGGSYPYGEFGPNGSHVASTDFDAPPVIILHGIKGAKLVKINDPQKDYNIEQACQSLSEESSNSNRSVEFVWGYTGNNGLFPVYEKLALYPPASLPNDKPWDDQQYYSAMDPLKSIRPDKVLTRFWIGWKGFPIFDFELYAHLVDFLKDEPIWLPVEKRLFLFSYDWRLDNRVAAILLANCLSHYEKNYLDFQARLALPGAGSGGSEATAQRIQQCVEESRRDSTEKPRMPSCRDRWDRLKARGAMDPQGNVRFTVVTHSMGGLLGRYFAHGLGYKGRIHKLVLFGSPNQGGMDAMRAMLEGERPPTFWHYLGINWFSAVATTKIHLSFGSLFQLLPRYRGAVVDLQTGRDLTEEYGLGEGAITPQTIAKWKDLLSFKDVDLDKYKGILDRYLEFQLSSARCFHLAITEPPMRCGDEDQRIKQITDYLQQHYPSVKTLPAKGSGRHEPPIINFGGQCDSTLATMTIDKTKETDETNSKTKITLKEVVFLDHDATEPGEQSRWFASDTYLVGDNRVPVKSLDYPRQARPGDASFLVCENHVGIIKDENLLYNLLRAIYY